jgi:hypothetical protein
MISMNQKEIQVLQRKVREAQNYSSHIGEPCHLTVDALSDFYSRKQVSPLDRNYKLRKKNDRPFSIESYYLHPRYSEDEELRLIREYCQRKRSKEKEGLPKFLLTESEFIGLMNDAGVTIRDFGRGVDDYCLGRYGDTGPYEIGNCRVITVRENAEERRKIHPQLEFDF